MTSGSLGCVIFVDENGELEAVLSDGDLRRALMSGEFSLEAKAIDFANKNPKYIKDENYLAIDALGIIEKYEIQMVVITDENKRVLGILDVHELIKAGIK
jgi:arabinose-5-phosphate isomerase